ncbi:hypothetical protein Godav_029241 [Gossypium davidsonii]|uniref:Uncharacterized protein n=1 Tax=Gossypium davidsonii TaxID=34287 RepID=A0A7J8TEJ8_GOSDV|nr:hypothetical protein [Gossypium davidsonii]
MAYLQPLIIYILAALAIFSLISNGLVKVFRTDLHAITNRRLVPWGNTEIHCQVYNSVLHFNVLSLLTNEVQFLFGVITNYSFCDNVQHGEEERHLNTIHSCVIHLWPDAVTSMSHNEKLRLNEEIINKCYTTGFGYKLLLQYANETAHMKPPQEDVPWVVVNNQPLRQDFENFVKYVRQDYKGDHKPATRKAQSSNLSPTIHALPQQPAIPHFYKLALQWPPSVCSSTPRYKTPTPTEFTIHGIWAQDANDKPVPPYSNLHPCTNPQPIISQSDLRVCIRTFFA